MLYDSNKIFLHFLLMHVLCYISKHYYQPSGQVQLIDFSSKLRIIYAFFRRFSGLICNELPAQYLYFLELFGIPEQFPPKKFLSLCFPCFSLFFPCSLLQGIWKISSELARRCILWRQFSKICKIGQKRAKFPVLSLINREPQYAF